MRAGPALAGLAALWAVPALGQPVLPVLNTLAEVRKAVGTCWHVPEALRGFERLEATVRFSLRSDGSLIGEQRLTFVASPVDGRGRELLGRSVLDSLRACAPLPLSEGLGHAIAGRVFTVRLIYSGPKGRGA